jgi:hypothetical protein
MSSPRLDQDASPGKRVEDLRVEQFITDPLNDSQ